LINDNWHFTLVHEIFKSLSLRYHLIQEDMNSHPEDTTHRTSLEKDWSIMINYKGHFTLVHEIFKYHSPPHHWMQEDVNSSWVHFLPYITGERLVNSNPL
jgi:hypothetical protein